MCFVKSEDEKNTIRYPTLKEEHEILIYIDDLNKKTKTVINLKLQEITKLKENKSSLVNSVVTGKVKVC